MLVFDVDIVPDEFFHYELSQVSLLSLCKRSYIAYNSPDASLLFEQKVLVFLKNIAELGDMTASCGSHEEAFEAFGEYLLDYVVLLVIGNEGIAECIRNVGTGLESCFYSLNVLARDIKADKLFKKVFAVVFHHLSPSSSERNSSTRRRFFSSSRLAPTIFEAASIARSAICD